MPKIRRKQSNKTQPGPVTDGVHFHLILLLVMSTVQSRRTILFQRNNSCTVDLTQIVFLKVCMQSLNCKKKGDGLRPLDV